MSNTYRGIENCTRNQYRRIQLNAHYVESLDGTPKEYEARCAAIEGSE